jgi:O-acetyl-ADP-ribose deacetylase (regulator of RNase III)
MKSNFIDESELKLLTLCDTNPEMVRAWGDHLGSLGAGIRHGDILKFPAVCIVAPGNSYGLMSGGLDLAIAKRFPGLEDRVQAEAPIPVGEVRLFETEDSLIPRVLYAPTMETAKDVSKTSNAFLVLRAILRFCDGRAVVVPGLCAGVGRMPCDIVARQMAAAYIENRTVPYGG